MAIGHKRGGELKTRPDLSPKEKVSFVTVESLVDLGLRSVGTLFSRLVVFSPSVANTIVPYAHCECISPLYLFGVQECTAVCLWCSGYARQRSVTSACRLYIPQLRGL